MSWRRAAATLGIALAGLTAAHARPHTSIQVRFYALVPLLEAELRATLDSAQGIFAQAEVDVEWLDCSESSSAIAEPLPCTSQLRANDFLLRFAESPKTATGKDPLGLSIVDVTAGVGVLATVYVNRVNQAASVMGVNRHTLMGRVAAHEIGHLLLGPGRHTRTGLMRADWSPQSLQRSNLRDWLFSKGESGRMQAGIVARQQMSEDAIARLEPRR